MPKKKAEAKRWWLVYVLTWGTFFFEGTEAEAQERRAAKANWEGSPSQICELPEWAFKLLSEEKENYINHCVAFEKKIQELQKAVSQK